MRQPLHSRSDIQDSIKGHHHRLMFITPLLMLQTAFLLVICLFLSLLCSGLQEVIFPRCQIDFPVSHWPEMRTEKGKRVFLSLSGLGWVAALPFPSSHQAIPHHWIPQDSGFWEHHLLPCPAGTRGDKRFPTVGVSGLPILWSPMWQFPILHSLERCLFLPGPNWQIWAKPN